MRFEIAAICGCVFIFYALISCIVTSEVLSGQLLGQVPSLHSFTT